MLKKLIFTLAASTVAFASCSALAADPSLPTASPVDIRSTLQTVFSVGIQWDFGDNRPDFVAGVRRTQTNITSHVIGSKADLSFPLTYDDGFQPRIRVLALAGNRTAQGEAGVGVAFNKSRVSPLLAAGVQLPYVNGGANYVFGAGFKPYLGVNTLQRVAGPTRTGGDLFCAAGSTLYDATTDDLSQFIRNGKICYTTP